MSEQTFHDFIGVGLHPRQKKPRSSGLTMVIDTGYSRGFVEHVLEMYGHLIDVAKLTELHLTIPVKVLRRKIEAYQAHDIRVQPGGIILEIANAQNKGKQALDRLRELGFDQIEFSRTATSESGWEREKIQLEHARSIGFVTVGEVGRKFIEGDTTRKSENVLDVEATVAEMKSYFEAGAGKVYWEGHVLRQIMGNTAEEIMQKAATGTPQVLEVVKQIGAGRIMFEQSGQMPYLQRRAQQFWLVRLFGPDVNVANVRLEEVQILEHTRLGTWPIFGFGPLGDHPYIKSLEREGGAASATWWRDTKHPQHNAI